MSFFRKLFAKELTPPQDLGHFWGVDRLDEDGFLHKGQRSAFMLELDGLDGSFLSGEQFTNLHHDWRSILRFNPGDELQVVFRKRVEFAKWVEDQLRRAFLVDTPYGKQILLDRLADQVRAMGREQPQLLAQKIIATYWTDADPDPAARLDRRRSLTEQMSSFGFTARVLTRAQILNEINLSAQDLGAGENQEPEWPTLEIAPGQLSINKNRFRALELRKLPEAFTELGMIQAITSLPYPLDICLRLTALDTRPIVSRLEKKRNLLHAQRANQNAPSAPLDNQVEQIDQVLQNLASRSESVFQMRLTVGLRLPENLGSFLRQAVADLIRSAAKMNFCEFEESTLSTFDSYLECIPSFRGENIRAHTVLGSNAIGFLPFFRPARGDARAVMSFETRGASVYGIDPVDSRLANYNWLVSGTSGAGKSFFVNSLLAQSASLNPNIFIVDIGGSYNRLTQFLNGRVMSLEADRGFKLSPIFLSKSTDPGEERTRRQHVFQIFLEMTRVDGQLPAIEVRHVLQEALNEMLALDVLPDRPISALIQNLHAQQNEHAARLEMLLKPWGDDGFFAQYLDNNHALDFDDRILTVDLKGLTEFGDLARVVQLIICAGLWARIRRARSAKFSWIVLDEVAFSLLKTQPQFVDELVSTLRKYFAGAIVVVQDLEKITSNLAGSSILQNTQSKAILQQRGDPRNFAAVLDLTPNDQAAIASLRRKKGSFSEIFLMRDGARAIIRHVPSALEYWLATTAPEDNLELNKSVAVNDPQYQTKIIDFASRRRGVEL